MKNMLMFFLLNVMFCFNLIAGTISGEITYSGSSSHSIYVFAFSDSNFTGEYEALTTLTSPGSYTLSDLDDGTYYILALMFEDPEYIKVTDPFGFYADFNGLIPVLISGNNNVSNINITLIDGTNEFPNPFGSYYTNPDQIIELPDLTQPGESSCIVYDGTSILLYKHDYSGAASGKIFVINPSTGEVTNTHYLSLESLPNKISWIDKLVFHNGELWGKGGYGNLNGTGFTEGIFKIDISTSSCSNQMTTNNSGTITGGFSSDGTYLYVGIDSMNVYGVSKFNPLGISEIPTNLFVRLNNRVKNICYGDNHIWAAEKKLYKINPNNGTIVGTYNFASSQAQLFFNNKFWAYDKSNNLLRIYNLETVTGIEETLEINPTEFILNQNYPNPFNPTTVISFQIPLYSKVKLIVYDILGNEIAVLVNEEKSPGKHEVIFDGSRLPSGIYLYSIITSDFKSTKKFLLMK